jgi:OOP family OmpA-OmpF porin
LLILSTAVGCSNRRWGPCALAGGLAGAAIGGGTGAGLAAGYEKHGRNDNDTVDTIGIGLGSAAGGALLGTLLGHVICDPEEAPPPPPPAPQAAPPPPPPAKGTKIATIGGAQFDFNRAEIKPAGRDVLDGAVKVLRDNPSLHVVVEGHTDSIGSDAYNQKLSERRAKAVRDYLVRQGIDPSRITTRGYGKSRPVATNATEEGRAQNRRADIVAD